MDFANVNSPISDFSTKVVPDLQFHLTQYFWFPQNQCYPETFCTYFLIFCKVQNRVWLRTTQHNELFVSCFAFKEVLKSRQQNLRHLLKSYMKVTAGVFLHCLGSICYLSCLDSCYHNKNQSWNFCLNVIKTITKKLLQWVMRPR